MRLCAVEMGKIVNVRHHNASVEYAEIATANGVIFARNVLDYTVDTKAFFKKLHELLRKPFV